MGEVTLETVFERLGARPGVEGVTLATLEGLVVHSSREGAAVRGSSSAGIEVSESVEAMPA